MGVETKNLAEYEWIADRVGDDRPMCTHILPDTVAYVIASLLSTLHIENWTYTSMRDIIMQAIQHDGNADAVRRLTDDLAKTRRWHVPDEYGYCTGILTCRLDDTDINRIIEIMPKAHARDVDPYKPDLVLPIYTEPIDDDETQSRIDIVMGIIECAETMLAGKRDGN